MELEICDGGDLFPFDAGGATFPEVDIKDGRACEVQGSFENGARGSTP